MSRREKIFLTLIMAVIIAGLIRTFVLEAFIVRGDSMAPAIVDGDYVFINRLAYLFGEPKRGDVVIALTRDPENRVIKRIIGLPGERLEVNSGKVYIRRGIDAPQELVEVYLSKQVTTSGTTTIKIDPREYFALGDNREVSVDSRELGPVDLWDIKGEAFLIFNIKSFSIRSI